MASFQCMTFSATRPICRKKIENNMASCKVSLSLKPMVGFKIFQKCRHWCSLCYFSRLLSGWTLPIRCLCRQHQLCWGTGSGTGRVCIDTTPLGSRGNSWAAAKMEQLPPLTAGHFQSNARWLRWSAQLRLRFTVHLSRIFKGEMRSRWTLCRGPKVGPLTDTAGSAEKEESLGAGLVSLVLKIGFWFWAIPISSYFNIWFGRRWAARRNMWRFWHGNMRHFSTHGLGWWIISNWMESLSNCSPATSWC